MTSPLVARAEACIDMAAAQPPLDPDREAAADFVAIAIDPAIPYTRAIVLVAERIAAIRREAMGAGT